MEKTVFITGSGKRLGKELAIKFAEKGWNVGLHYNNSEENAEKTQKIIENLGVKTSLVQFDLKKTDEIKRGLQQAYDNLGTIDILINNASLYTQRITIDNTEIDDWNMVMDTNLRAVFYCSKLFAERAKENSRIINIGCLSSLEVWKNRIAYNLSKAGVLKLTELLARELAPKIAVNAINPGSLKLKEEPLLDDTDTQLSKIPMERYGTADDIFEAAYFFSTCTNYITGQYLNIDGGNHLVK